MRPNWPHDDHLNYSFSHIQSTSSLGIFHLLLNSVFSAFFFLSSCSLGNYPTPSTFSSPHLSLSSFPCACHLSSLAEAYRPVLLDHTASAGGMSLITVALIFPKSSLVPSFHPVPFCFYWNPWLSYHLGASSAPYLHVDCFCPSIHYLVFFPHSFSHAVMAHFDYRLFSPLQSAQQSEVQNE